MDDDWMMSATGGWSTPTPKLWDIATNTNSNTWNRNGHPAPPAKTSAEFAKINTEVMTKEQVLRQLNNALVALEESEAAWQEEHDARVAAEETVEALREAGFTGVPEESDDDEELDNTFIPEYTGINIPPITAPRGSVSYKHALPSHMHYEYKIDREQVTKDIIRRLKEARW